MNVLKLKKASIKNGFIPIYKLLLNISFNMRSFIILTMLLGFISFMVISCDNREDAWINEANVYLQIKRSPADSFINLDKGTIKNFVDSIKLKYKATFYYTTSQNNLTKIRLDKNSYNSSLATIEIDSINHELKYTPLVAGSNKVKILLYDPFGHTSDTTLNFFHYKNLPPIALFNVSKVNGTVIIDASASRDQDAKYGGKIELYDYQIVGTTIRDTTNQPIYKQSLNTTGTFNFVVRVIDNDKESSKPLTISYTLK